MGVFSNALDTYTYLFTHIYMYILCVITDLRSRSVIRVLNRGKPPYKT